MDRERIPAASVRTTRSSLLIGINAEPPMIVPPPTFPVRRIPPSVSVAPPTRVKSFALARLQRGETGGRLTVIEPFPAT